jgi:hypothetical protein
MVASGGILLERQITAAPRPTAIGAASWPVPASGPLASITETMPTMAPQLMQMTAVVAPLLPPPEWKWQPQAMNEIQTSPASAVAASGVKKSQVSSTRPEQQLRA